MHSLPDLIKSNRGFSLIQVLVSVGILGIVTLGIGSLTEFQAKSQNASDFRAEVNTLVEEIRSTLSSEQACLHTFGSRLVSETAGSTNQISDIRNSTNAAVFVANSLYGNRSIRISSINYGSFQPSSLAYKGTMTLNFNFLPNKTVAGFTSLARSIDLSVERGATNQITRCLALSKMSDGIFQRSSTNMNNIFYVGGNDGGFMGLGTSNPRSGIHLLGNGDSEDDFTFSSYTNTPHHSGTIFFDRSRGTETIPQYLQAGDSHGGVAFRSFNGGTTFSNASLISSVTETTNTANPLSRNSALTFHVEQRGTMREKMRLTSPGYLSLGANTALAKFHIVGENNGSVSGVLEDDFRLDSYDDGVDPGNSATVNFVRSRGSQLAPRTVQRNDVLGSLNIWGRTQNNVGSLNAATGEYIDTTAITAQLAFKAEDNFTAIPTSQISSMNVAFRDATSGLMHNKFTFSHTGFLGVNTVPWTAISIVGDGVDSDDIVVRSYSQDSGSTATLYLERLRGTPAAPAPPLLGDSLGNIIFRGVLPGNITVNSGEIQTSAESNYTTDPNSHNSYMTLSTTRTGAVHHRVLINSQGHVGINNLSPSFHLDVMGDIRSQGCFRTSGGVIGGSCFSDQRLKTEIKPFNVGLEQLLGVSPKSFKYNGLGGLPESKTSEIGLIAQELEAVAPELITTDKIKLKESDAKAVNVKKVNYTSLIYVVINAVKEFYQQWFNDSQQLHRKIAVLEEKQKQTEHENRILQERLLKLEALLNK